MSASSSPRTRVWFGQGFSSVRTALALIRSADVDHRYTLIASAHANSTGIEAEADEFFIEPTWSTDQAGLDWYEAMLKAYRVDIFIPGHRAQWVAAHRDHFEACGVRVLTATSASLLDTLDNKTAFYAQVNCPTAPPTRWRSFETLAQFNAAWKTLIPQASSGLCMKPARSVYGRGFTRIQEDKSAYELFCRSTRSMTLDTVRRMLGEQPIVEPMVLMDYLPGDEYSVDCAADQGVLGWAVVRVKSRTRAQCIVSVPRVEQACAAIVAQFRLNGVVNIQFIESANGLHVLEVNARMSGGVGLSCLAGVNLPYLALRGFDLGSYTTLPRTPIQTPLTVAMLSAPTIVG